MVRPIPFGLFVERVGELYEPPVRRPFTARRMERVLRRCIELGAASTSDLTPELVRKFIDNRPKGESPNTTHTHVAVLRAACNVAVEREWLAVSPFTIRKRWVRRVAGRRKKHHGLEEIARVLELLAREAAEATGRERWRRWRLRALVSVVAYTGVRKMEACRLMVEDVDLAEGLIVLVERDDSGRMKTENSAQPVPVPRELAEVLAGWLGVVAGEDAPREVRERGAGWLFPNATGDGPWVDGGIKYRPLDAFKAAGRRAGVEGFTFLSLRHSWGTHAERWGLSDTMIQRVLRHTNTRTQWHYRHADLANLKRAASGVSFASAPDAGDVGAHGDFARRLAELAGVPEVSRAKAEAIRALLL